MTVIANVVSQHAEEAAMLWLLRRSATQAPHYSLADLAKIDGRVEAHLDGLRIAGEEGWRICEEQLAANEEGEVFAASVVAFESGSPGRIVKVLSVVEEEQKAMAGLVSAVGWLTFEQAQTYIKSFLATSSPVQRRIGVAVCAIHG